MISNDFMDQLNSIRKVFVSSLTELDQSPSFTMLRQSMGLNDAFEQVQSKLSRKLFFPFENRFVLAIAGSSGHGKTTILHEMFPSLADRGWLVTDVTDTTSQSLRIEYAPNLSSQIDQVSVHSWRIDQIKKLFHSAEVAKQNENDQIRIDYKENHVEVDGTNATFEADDLKEFRFSLKQTLIPFSEPYQIPPERLNDEKFIQAITTKEPVSKLETAPVLEVGGESYNSLQLRVVVKDISLHDNFSPVHQWTGMDEEELQSLVFVDTPGIAVSGSVKDEVLRHPLEYKSSQILLELLREDELDIIIHLVLCGRQTDFSTLWKLLENECGTIQMEDLSERLILAVNGFNMYFTNVDLKKHVTEGDQFEITLEENILQKMSPRGRIQPATVCFLDSKRIVENTFGTGAYQQVYDGYYDQMQSWLAPDSKPHSYLKSQNLLDAFQDNMEALKNPDDRGQGFLVRQTVDLIRQKGPRLLVKKYLIRTDLLSRCEQLYEMVSGYYDESGCLSTQITNDAIQSVFSIFQQNNKLDIHEFCQQHIDPKIQSFVMMQLHNENWIESSFASSCEFLIMQVLQEANPPEEIRNLVRDYFAKQIQHWSNAWGYAGAQLPMPSESNKRTLILVSHSIKTHIREILYQLSGNAFSGQSNLELSQSEEDREAIRLILARLKTAIESGNELCRSYGVDR